MRYRTELMDEILKSQTAQRIIDFVAPIYGNGYVALWMFQAIGKPLDAIASFVDSLRDQTIPQTATWSLPIWEQEYGVTPDPAWTDAQRQANLVSKMKYIPPVNPAKLAEYASAAAGVPCEVIENVAKNTFAVVLRANSDTIDRAKQAIDEAKPAHLIYIIYVALLRETQADVCTVIAACDNPESTTGGYDEEDDAAYYARYLLKIRTPATSGNIYHYQSWALEVAGVGAVQVFPLARGPGTVDIVLIDSTGQPAPPDLVQQVQDYIDPGGTGEGYGQAPIGAQCRVEAATGTEIALSATVFKLDTAEQETVTAGIKAAVGAYLAEIAFQQDYVSLARITERILAVEGVRDLESLTLNGGTDNVHLDERACAVLGEVALSYA